VRAGTRVVVGPVLVVRYDVEAVVVVVEVIEEVLHEVPLNTITRVKPSLEQSGVTYSVRVKVVIVRL
jgi:hypothetical protein